jgi:hypothetical protein
VRTTIRPDPGRATSLRRQAQLHLERIRATDRVRFADLIVVDYYDALHKLAEARSVEDGAKFSGDGAHEELLAYVANRTALSGADATLLKELRKRRNAFHYEGVTIGGAFLENNETRLHRLVGLLGGTA